MSRPAKISLVAVIALLMTAIAFTALGPKCRYYLQVFDLGVKHGVEDKQSGLKYATDDPAWKVVRNGRSWTSREKLLVQHLFAEPPASAKSDTSIFMAGYTWGNNAMLCWAVVSIVLAGVAVLVLRTTGRKRVLTQSR